MGTSWLESYEISWRSEILCEVGYHEPVWPLQKQSPPAGLTFSHSSSEVVCEFKTVEFIIVKHFGIWRQWMYSQPGKQSGNTVLELNCLGKTMKKGCNNWEKMQCSCKRNFCDIVFPISQSLNPIWVIQSRP